jgi:hypothetical protein
MSEIEDRFAIEDLLYLYAFLADTDQFHRIADEVFAEDAVLDWGVREVNGRAALRAWFGAPRPGLRGTSHNISNVMVRIDGDSASALSKMVAWHWFDDGSDATPLQPSNAVIVGGYQDELRREPQGWRITRRTAHQFGPGGIGTAGPVPPMIAKLVEATVGRRPEW